MQGVKAIDIVLIPPKEIYDLSLKLSNSLNKGIKPVIQLNETHLPHITLVQLYVRDDQIKELIGNIDQVVGLIKPLNLKITGLKRDSNNTAAIDIHLSAELNKLYEKIMEMTQDFEAKSAKDGFLLDSDETIWIGAVKWVANYRNKLEYNPHISLAQYPLSKVSIQPEEFTADRLAICHLGNFCTCRKIFKEWKLTK